MSSEEKLACYFCQREFPYDPYRPLCPNCHEPLGFIHSGGRRSIQTNQVLPLQRFLGFLPLDRIDPRLSLGEGNTPLVRLDRLPGALGGLEVWAKNETSNPTYSFKDRGTAVVVQKAAAMGIPWVGTVSTGNMAASTAAFGAKAGLKTIVLVKEDTTPEKMLSASVYGCHLIKVAGDYGRLFERSLEIGRKRGIYFANSVDPVRVEGYKITGFEVFEQLESRPPGYVFVPLSSGGHLIGLTRAFLDLKAEGLIQTMPVMVGVQASGCSPLSRAFASGADRFRRFARPRTIAQAISNPSPPGGNVVLKLIRENRGLILDVSDEEMRAAQRWLAEQAGIFCLPDSATTLAGLIKLSARARIDPTAAVVLLITGTGLKNLKAAQPSSRRLTAVPLSGLDEAVGRIEKA